MCAYSSLITSKDGKLNTDLLRERWGPIHVEIARKSTTDRAVLFRDASGEIRGGAVSRFEMPLSPSLRAAHIAIQAGGSMGQVFQQQGFEISKESIDEFEGPPSDGLLASLGAQWGTRRRYMFRVRKPGGEWIPYAFVDEWTAP